MAFIRKVRTKSGATAVQIAHSVYGKLVKIEHIGSAHNEAELELLTALARNKLTTNQATLFDPGPVKTAIIQKRSVSALLYSVLQEQYEALGFGTLSDEDFINLCIARIVEPTSKLDSIRVLDDLGINVLSKDRLYRCLKRIIAKDYHSQLAKLCFAHASTSGDLTLVLYDVTTLYFEVQEEDGYRKPGLSKERRLDPQIVVGLLVDRTGFPLELHSFEGNKAETKTILPVMDSFRQRHRVTNLTVVADAGMLSHANLTLLAEAGYSYIVGSRLNKIPYGISQYQKKRQLTDGQVITSKTNVPGQRVIHQYREKRAALDRRNIAKQIAKAENIVRGKAPVKRSKFVKLSSKGSTRSLNTELIDKALSLAGIKGYVTNLDAPAKEIIASYHELWHVEQSFRMSKSDLKARPIFHHKQEAIEAHLTVVMAALAVSRVIQNRTGLTTKRLVKQLRTVRSGVVEIEGKQYTTEPDFTSGIKELLKLLRTH